MINVTATAIEDQHTSGAYPKRPLSLSHGDGCTVWDDTGQAYLDATSGQGVALLGHSHPALVEAVTTQASQMITCPEIFYNERRAELYTHLNAILPEPIDRFFLCNSGAEAIEGALKLARLLTQRTGIIAAKRGFHGRTLGALALTWNKIYRQPFAAWQPDVTHVPYNDIDAIRAAISSETAAVVVEAIQGEGGVYPAESDYLRSLRALCYEHDTLLIIDEIQTGIGRTGRWFAFEHSGIVPDVVAMAKGIAGGVPMGAVAWRGELGTMPRSAHGSTFGGNPLACAAAIATLTTIQTHNLIAQAAEQGAWLRAELDAQNLTQVRDVRGMGVMIALELRGRVTPILKTLQTKHHILALPAGLNVLRLLPPLIITREEVTRLRDAIVEVLA